MSVRTDVVNLNININGDKARNELNQLKKRAADITFEMKGLVKGTAEYTAKAKELATVNTQMTELKKTIGITALTQKELIAELNKLKSLRGSVTPFTKEYDELSKSIKQVENRLYDVKNGVQGFSSFFSKIKDEVKQFGVMAAGYLGFQFISSQFSSIISGAGKLSDSLAAVRKTTGLSAEGVKELNAELKAIDTRTSNEALRDLAKEAGKLGIQGKEQVLEFVRAADQIKVALGEDLGDDAITKIGKLVSVFRIDEQFGLEKSILKTGSAINELGAASAANEGYIVDFTSRLAGIAPSAKISIQDIAALGATLDSLGIQSELGSTAIGNVLSKLVTDFEGFAKISGVSAETLKKSFQEKGALEALKLVLSGVKNTTGGFDDFIVKLGDVGVEGSRAKSVFGALAENLDKLDANQQIANKSFSEGISITEEFTLQNQTFGATLDKLSKEFNSFVSSPAVTGFLQGAVEGALKFIDVLRTVPKFFAENKAGIIILTLAYIAYNAEQIKARILALLNTQVLTGQAAAVRLLAAAKFLLTGNITKAKEAWNAFTAAIGKNPLGLILTVIGLVAIAITTLTGKFKALTAEQRVNQEVQKKAGELYQDEIAQTERLKKVLTDATSTLTQKKNAYQELIKIHPDFANTMTLDEQGHLKGAEAIDQFILSLRRKGQAEAREAVASEKRRSVVQKGIDLASEFTASSGSATGTGQSQLDQLASNLAKQELNPKALALSDNNKKILKNRAAEIKKQMQDAINETPDNAFSIIENAYKQLGIDVEKSKLPLNKTFKELKGIKEELNVLDKQTDAEIRKKLDTKTGTGSGAAAAGGNDPNSVAARRAKLEAEIKALKESYEKLAVADQAGRSTNLARQKAAQEELDLLDGRSAKEKSTKKQTEYNDLLARAKKFYEEIKELEQRTNAGDDLQQQDIIKVQQKYKALLDEAALYYSKNVTSEKQNAEEIKIINEALQKDLADIRKKYEAEQDGKYYEQGLIDAQEYSDKRKTQVSRDYAAGTISKADYEKALKEIEKDQTFERITLAETYSGTVKKAATDLKAFYKTNEQGITSDLISEYEARQNLAKENALATARIEVLKTRPGTKDNLEAKKDLLKLETQNEIDEIKAFYAERNIIVEDSDAILVEKVEEKNKKIEELDQEFARTQIDKVTQYVQYFVTALDGINRIISNKENAQFAKDKALNAKKQKEYKQQLDNKLISQGQYDKKLEKLKEEQDKKDLELKRKQAKREKALNLFRAIVNIASGVATSLSYGPPAGYILAAITAALGAIEIATIASTPLPTAGRGKLLSGDKHSDPSGGIHIMAEDGEAVINRRNMADNRNLTVSGTTKQISSYLNSRNGNGVNWAGGAIAKSSDWAMKKPSRINNDMPRIMAAGGVVTLGTTATVDARQAVNRSAVNNTTDQLLGILINETRKGTEAINSFDREKRSTVLLSDINEKNNLLSAARKASGLNQNQ